MHKRLAEREKKAKEDFYKAYEKYKEVVSDLSDGLVETNKADFIKFSAFTQVVLNPVFEQFYEEVKKLHRKG